MGSWPRTASISSRAIGRSGVIRAAAHLRPGGAFVVVEYDADRGNPWVPHPFSAGSWDGLAAAAGLVDTTDASAASRAGSSARSTRRSATARTRTPALLSVPHDPLRDGRDDPDRFVPGRDRPEGSYAPTRVTHQQHRSHQGDDMDQIYQPLEPAQPTPADVAPVATGTGGLRRTVLTAAISGLLLVGGGVAVVVGGHPETRRRPPPRRLRPLAPRRRGSVGSGSDADCPNKGSETRAVPSGSGGSSDDSDGSGGSSESPATPAIRRRRPRRPSLAIRRSASAGRRSARAACDHGSRRHGRGEPSKSAGSL